MKVRTAMGALLVFGLVSCLVYKAYPSLNRAARQWIFADVSDQSAVQKAAKQDFDKKNAEFEAQLNHSSAASSSDASDGNKAGRRYLGAGPTGYQLWADDSCVYVKGITEGDLARLRTDVWGFKKVIKEQTGYSCVIYE